MEQETLGRNLFWISLVFILLAIAGTGFFFFQSPSETQDSIPINAIDSITGNVEREILLKNPRYQNGDLDAIFDDIELPDVLDFKLKSHPNVNYIKQVGLGNQVVMYYDINSVYQLENALGTPEFWDMKTGQLVDREWRYVVWGEETRQRQVCAKEGTTTNGTIGCVEWATENYIVELWKEYTSRDLKGKQRIGIEVEVKLNDHIDGVWVVGGKRIDRHAEWEQVETITFPDSTNTESTDNYAGVKIEAKMNITAINVTKYASTTADKASIYLRTGTGTGTHLETVSFSGNLAVFNTSLVNGSQYFVMVHKAGASYTRAYYNGDPGYPISNNHTIAVSAARHGGSAANDGFTNRVENIKSITTEVEPLPGLEVTLLSPEDNANLTSSSVDFLLNVSEEGGIAVENVTIEVSNSTSVVFTETNTTGLLGNYTFNSTFDDGSYNWTAWAYGNDSERYNATETRSFSIDATDPVISLISPNETFNYLTKGQTLYLTGFANDTNLDTVWYEYNNTNTTISGATTETLFNQSFSQGEFNQLSITVYANDTFGNIGSGEISWNFDVFENNIDYTLSTFETKTETFTANITSGSDAPTLGKLIYNETTYSSATITNLFGDTYTISRTIDIPLNVTNNDFFFNFTIGGTEYSTNTNSQEVNLTFFTPLNATYTVPFLNVTFKDENTLENINASIPLSEFVYYLGTGTVNKTLDFVDNTDNFNFAFAGTTGGENLKVLPVIQYRRVNDYPQRIWEPTLRTYNSTMTTQPLYLLNTNDGIFVTYQVLTTGDSPISDVEVIATRVVSGETIQVGAGATDSAGTVTFWMNPDFQHTTTFTHPDYETFVFVHFPNQNAYTITMGGEVVTIPICSSGITQSVRPTSGFLFQNEIYSFNYTVSSTYWNLTSFQFTLTDGDGASIGSQSSSSSSGGTLSLNNINISDTAFLTMNYLYEIDSSEDEGVCGQITGERVWLTQTTTGTEFSIWALSQTFNSYVDNDLYGIDDFGKTLISFVIIFLMVGGLTRRYGLASEPAIMGVLFGTVFLLEARLGLIPRIVIGDVQAIPNFLTFITFIILFIVVIRGER